MSRCVAAALLVCVATTPAAGQQADHFPPQQAFRATFQGGESAGVIKIDLQTKGLPEKTSVSFRLSLDEGDIPPTWRRFYVGKDGRLLIEIGPIKRKLLPANYSVQMKVLRRHQGVSLTDFFASWTRDVEQNYTWSYKASDEPQARAEFKKKLLGLVDGALATMDAVLKAGDAYRSGKAFRKGGRFDKEAFLKWAHERRGELHAFDRAIRTLARTYLAPYWATALHFQCPNVELMTRLVVVDYPIDPILTHESVPVPRQLQPDARLGMKPSRNDAIARARLLAREIRREVEGGGGTELLTLLPPPEGRPVGFVAGPLPAPLAGIVKTNPGATGKLSKEAARRLTARLGVRIAHDRIDQFAVLVLQPEAPAEAPKKGDDAKKKPETTELYLFRFKKEFYGTMVTQMLARQRQLGRFTGRVLKKQNLLAVVTGPAKAPHTGAIRRLAAFMSQKQRFQDAP